jgi:signal transduction histidine kinase
VSIRLRLTLLFSAATLILLVGGGVLFVNRLDAELDQNLTLTLRTRADKITSALGAVAKSSSTDPLVLRETLRRSAGNAYVQLLGHSGTLVASSRFVEQTPLLTTGQMRVARHRTIVMDRSVSLPGAVDPGPEPMRLLARNVSSAGDVIVVALNRDVVDQAGASARNQLLLLGVAVFLLAGPGAWLLTGAALRPVERIRREARDLHARDAGAGVRVPKTHDEIARLAETFNALLARVHAALAREQTLVADAGHELRTPLTVLKGELELARRPNRTREELVQAVEVASEETDRLVRLAEDLLFLSREAADEQRPTHAQEFDVAAVAQRAVLAMQTLAAERSVRLCLDAPAPAPCVGNSDGIRRAIDNLLANALRHAPSGSAVTVRVAADERSIRLAVADEGSGFPPEFLPSAFDRFTRADDSRVRTPSDATYMSGSGLGLAIVQAIMVRHGGRASAANRPEGGAEVTLVWPAVAWERPVAGS